MLKLICLATMTLCALTAQAETHFFGVGINDYKDPLDERGQAVLDAEGQPVDLDLKGCNADLDFYSAYFKKHAKIKDSNMTLLRDGAANGEDFVNKLKSVLTNLNAGDTFYFTFSGHGMNFASDKEDDKTDEYLVLSDLVLFKDDAIKEMTDVLRGAGVHCIIIIDSCFAGGMAQDTPGYKQVRTRSVSPKMLGAKYRKAQTKRGTQLAGVRERARRSAEPLYLFACLEDQTSADVVLHSGKANGAFTMFLQKQLVRNPKSKTSDLVVSVNALLKKAGFAQQCTWGPTPTGRVSRPIMG